MLPSWCLVHTAAKICDSLTPIYSYSSVSFKCLIKCTSEIFTIHHNYCFANWKKTLGQSWADIYLVKCMTDQIGVFLYLYIKNILPLAYLWASPVVFISLNLFVISGNNAKASHIIKQIPWTLIFIDYYIHLIFISSYKIIMTSQNLHQGVRAIEEK